MELKFSIHADGGARGNPGPAAIGVIIEQLGGGLKKEYGEYIGDASNNEAEYRAVIFSLKKLKQLIGGKNIKNSSVEIFVDSELLERQINGSYKIMDKELQRLFLEVWNLKVEFGKVFFKHVLREKNKDADRLVNAALDKELNKLI